MRGATVWFAILVGIAACNDVRDFAGDWHGNRVGDSAVVRVGPGIDATLTIDAIDKHGLRGHLLVNTSVPGAPLIDASVMSLEAAEADALATMTFSGAPLRVYLAFVPVLGVGGDALAVVALFDAGRIELRVMRGGADPLYAIFALGESS